MESPFWHYQSTFDGISLVRQFEDAERTGRAGHWTSYFGVAVDTNFFPEILGPIAGQVEGDTLPANWHADLAEFAAALRAVSLAGESFTVVELGCGWGCWLNLTGVAARRSGKRVRLIGVEGDSNHLGFAREATTTNGFGDGDVNLIHGIAAHKGGWALFPNQQGSNSWGLSPIFTDDLIERDRALDSGAYQVLPMISLESLNLENSIDLLHIDIQGGEADLIDNSISFLNNKVAFMVIGTHSREIEGRLIKTLTAAGWRLEVERALINHLHLAEPLVSVDGVQGWRNMKLLPA